MKSAIEIETPLGRMVATGDDQFLYELRFTRDPMSLSNIKTKPLASIEEELFAYFEGRLTLFATPIQMEGTSFQQKVWKELQKIRFGATSSYSQIAQAIGSPFAVRAVGGANGANPLAIIVPCHRVIQANGNMGGYSAGLHRKEWLLRHEIKR